jgi:uridylate kinase
VVKRAPRAKRHSKPFKRIILKLSGEVLGGSARSTLDVDFARSVLTQIKSLVDAGIEVGVVVGGGNILRGASAAKLGLGRVAGDWIGMLGTVANGVALRDLGEALGLDVRLLSCLPCPNLAEPHSAEAAIAHMETGRVVIFVGGTGNPFLTTDTAAALRAIETRADVILKATKVDGVYSADPVTDRKAKRFARLTFDDAMRRDLRFMDRSSLCLCNEAGMTVIVFDIFAKDSIERAASGAKIGTIVVGVSND